MTGRKKPVGGTQTIRRALNVLRLLAEAPGPLTSTAVGKKIGIHQSSASRILRSLAEAGYVRKPDYHSFTVDLGILTLGADSIRHFPMSQESAPVLRSLANQIPGALVSLAALWDGQLIYLQRAQGGQEPLGISIGSFPIHLSSPGLRLLCELPDKAALKILEQSRRRYGWSRPTDRVPKDETAVLKAARSMVTNDCLALDRWQKDDRITVAIPINIPNAEPMAISIASNASSLTIDRACLILQQGRYALEALRP